MKTSLTFIILLTCSCAYGVEETLPAEQREKPVAQKPSEPTKQQTKACILKKKDYIKDCVLFTFICEDNTKEFAIACQIQPVGIITNPPRPVSDHGASNVSR